jgi:hypothetical protein
VDRRKSSNGLYLDISSIKGESYGGSCVWALVMDDHTDYCLNFLKEKVI